MVETPGAVVRGGVAPGPGASPCSEGGAVRLRTTGGAGRGGLNKPVTSSRPPLRGARPGTGRAVRAQAAREEPAPSPGPAVLCRVLRAWRVTPLGLRLFPVRWGCPPSEDGFEEPDK